MRRSLIVNALIISFLLGGVVLGKSNSMKISPAKPKAGGEVTITFNPAGTKLEKSENINMTAYFYSTKYEGMDEVSLVKTGKVFTGKLIIDSKAEIVGVKFNEGEKEETNDKSGYFIRLYNKDGKETDGSMAAYALAPSGWANIFGVKYNMEAAFKNCEKLFKAKPALKQKYIKEYLTAAGAYLKDKGYDLIGKELKAIENKGPLTIDEYLLLQRMYGTIKQKDKADEYKKIILDKFPQDPAAAGLVFSNIQAEKDVDKKIELFESFAKDFPGNTYYSPCVYMINTALLKEHKFDEGADFVKKHMAELDPAYMSYIAKVYISEKQKVLMAYELAQKAVEKARADLNSTEKKPVYMPENKGFESKNISLANTLVTLAEACALRDKREEAILLYEEALPKLTGDNADPEVNQKYIALLSEAGHIVKAAVETEKFIIENMPTESSTKLAREIYVRKNGSDTGFDQYIAKLAKDSKDNMVARLKKEMLDQPAPKFTLTDLEGKKISLASLKGKIVIIDYWATWCGYCIQSFPGMQKVVDKYAGDKDVAVLFIDTWENNYPTPSEKQKAVEEFIAKNSYRFHVLMDNDSKVVESYDVSGIPTKFILDKKGNIRFQVVGYDGNMEKLIEELSTMIEMLR
jgi:peroxiredoxin/tetratricopeptide (TPR) repeat protein